MFKQINFFKYLFFKVTILAEKKKNYREKKHCAIFIRSYFMWGLQLGLGLS